MEATSDYLTKNEGFQKFIQTVSDNTGREHMDGWIENLRENRFLFKRTGWAARHLQGKHRGKTAVIIGASPALANQITTLDGLQYDEDFVLCGLSSNLEYLLNNGIKPKYVITVDGDSSQGEFFNFDMERTRDITLIANTYAYPPMLLKWKGPLWFLALQTASKRFEKKHEKWFGPPNGIGEGFPSIMAQFNIMTALAFAMFECPIIIFVGHELSFKSDDSRYYVDREDFRDNEQRFPHGDIYGNRVETTMGLLAVKYSLEGFLEIIKEAGWFFNCTEAGIFGITKKFDDYHVPWIEQLKLEDGIFQARTIMSTGEPIYDMEVSSE